MEVRENAKRSRPIALTRAGQELMLNARPAWLTAQVQAGVLLGEGGVIALINVTDRILDHPTSNASVSSAESRTAVRLVARKSSSLPSAARNGALTRSM